MKIPIADAKEIAGNRPKLSSWFVFGRFCGLKSYAPKWVDPEVKRSKSNSIA
ncbi:MAG: hypothetical protein O3B75_07500 [Planctomycetota bacterium]|nr:hypothetical protein [Planctomycetota bacterium]